MVTGICLIIGIAIGSITTYLILHRRHKLLLRLTIDHYERLLCLALNDFEEFFPLPVHDRKRIPIRVKKKDRKT